MFLRVKSILISTEIFVVYHLQRSVCVILHLSKRSKNNQHILFERKNIYFEYHDNRSIRRPLKSKCPTRTHCRLDVRIHATGGRFFVRRAPTPGQRRETVKRRSSDLTARRPLSPLTQHPRPADSITYTRVRASSGDGRVRRRENGKTKTVRRPGPPLAARGPPLQPPTTVRRGTVRDAFVRASSCHERAA